MVAIQTFLLLWIIQIGEYVLRGGNSILTEKVCRALFEVMTEKRPK